MQKNTSSIKKANRSINNGKTQSTKATIAPTPKVPDTFTPLGDAIRKSSAYGELLVDGIEGLDYYQKAKSHISDLFINYMVNDEGEMSEEYKQLHVGLHTCIQALLDDIHREYVYGFRQGNAKIYESLETENFA